VLLVFECTGTQARMEVNQRQLILLQTRSYLGKASRPETHRLSIRVLRNISQAIAIFLNCQYNSTSNFLVVNASMRVVLVIIGRRLCSKWCI